MLAMKIELQILMLTEWNSNSATSGAKGTMGTQPVLIPNGVLVMIL